MYTVKHSDFELQESSLGLVTRPACRVFGLWIVPYHRTLSGAGSFVVR